MEGRLPHTEPASSHKVSWVLCAAALLAVVAAYVWANACGLHQTFDSRTYLAAARAGEWGLFTYHPGGYVAFLAVAERLGALWVLHLVAYCATVCLWVRLARFHLRPVALAWFAVALVGSVALLLSFSFVWSEALFLPAWSGLLALVVGRLRAPWSSAQWAVAVVLAAALPLTRYIGLPMVWMAAAALLVMRPRAWRGAVAVAAVSLTSLVGWWLWAGVTNGGQAEGWSWVAAAQRLVWWGFGLADWLLIIRPGQWAVAALAGLLLLYTLVWWVQVGWAQASPAVKSIALLAVGYVVLLWLVTSWFQAGHSDDGERLLSPAYPLVFLTLAWTGQQWLGQRSRQLRVYLAAVCLLWLSYPLLRTWNHMVSLHQANCAETEVPTDAVAQRHR